MKAKSLHILPIAALLLLAACDTHQKVLKSTDQNYKYERALAYYNKGECFKASPIFEELMGVYKGTDVNETIYYYYANCQYDQRQFLMSAYHYKRFYEQFPLSKNAQDALFKHADSYHRMTEKPPLDQSYTEEAIEAFQFFINSFPQSEKVADANQIITKLRRILEQKALNAANLYFKTGNFRASATTYELILQDFPDIDEAELCYFMSAKSRFNFADQSISSKKTERFEEAIESCKDFIYRYPDSKRVEAVSRFYENAHLGAVKGNYEYAQIVKPELRLKAIDKAVATVEKHNPELDSLRFGNEVNQIREHLSFLVVKTHYQLAQLHNGQMRLSDLQNAVSSYYQFVDKYQNSRYFREAERIFAASRENLNKLKTDG